MKNSEVKLYEAVNQVLAQAGGLLAQAKQAEDQRAFISQHMDVINGTFNDLDDLFDLWQRQALAHGVTPRKCAEIAGNLEQCRLALGQGIRGGH